MLYLILRAYRLRPFWLAVGSGWFDSSRKH
nr:MAG TPA: hypothetical protein [Bacteriophage sp.]